MSTVISILLNSLILKCMNGRVLNEIGRLYIPHTDIPGAENSAIDTDNDRIFVADGHDKSVNSLDFTLDTNLRIAEIEASKNIYLEPAFDELGKRKINISDVTCVAMSSKGYILATIVPVNHSINNGWLAFIDPTNQSVFNLYEMNNCYLPDHVTSTNDGNIILVSCEGEPSENEQAIPTTNPPGSVGYLNVSSEDAVQWQYINIGFQEFDIDGDKHILLPTDIYYPLPDPLPDNAFSLSAEPEHIVVDMDDTYAYIGLQESNAVAILDINAAEIINIFTLGVTDFGWNGGLDASDRDDMINIVPYDNLYGMRQPDDIDYFEFSTGRKFIFTANEGDSKGFDESRVNKLTLDDVFGDENYTTYLQDDAVLGRLKVSKLIGMNNESSFHELYTFSSRDFTVYEIISDAAGKPINISLHFSSANDFEVITSTLIPEGFNSDYSGQTFDARSDAKGPEPEGITVGECENGRKYVFICLERVGGIMAYDFTDIDNISFVDYVNNRNFSVKYDDEKERPPSAAGDIGPEQMSWIDGDVYGEPLLVVSHPQSASVTMYRIDCGEMVISTTKIPNDDSHENEILSTFEIVAIAVGSFALLSIILLFVYIIVCKRKEAFDAYKYNSLNEFGNNTTKNSFVQYFEVEK